jgi:hypothetical protein
MMAIMPHLKARKALFPDKLAALNYFFFLGSPRASKIPDHEPVSGCLVDPPNPKNTAGKRTLVRSGTETASVGELRICGLAAG